MKIIAIAGMFAVPLLVFVFLGYVFLRWLKDGEK